MSDSADKTQKQPSLPDTHGVSRMPGSDDSGFQFADNRPEAVAQRKFQALAANSSRAIQLKSIKKKADSALHVRQLKRYTFRDVNKSSELKKVADDLSDDVDTAKAIVDANPLLIGVEGRNGGYLNAWVGTFQEFLDEGEVPDFFYARYGYAIETIATGFFKARDLGLFKAHDQITYGATRPDFVIQQDGNDVAWLDITSEGSPGHIYDKQGGGWKSKPYVAEIRYEMPMPDDFKKTASGKLTEEQLKKLQSASSARAKEAANLAKGRDKMATLLSNALAEAYEKKGSGLSKTDTREAVIECCRSSLLKYVDKLTPKFAAGVLSSIETMEVSGEVSTGTLWAIWAFGNAGDARTGRALLASLGADT